MITSNCTWHVHLPRSVGHTFTGYILAAIGSTWHFCDLRGTQAFNQRGVRVSFGHPIADFGHPNIYIFWWIMQWDEKELDTQFTPNVYFWTPNSEILAKTLEELTGRLNKSFKNLPCSPRTCHVDPVITT